MILPENEIHVHVIDLDYYMSELDYFQTNLTDEEKNNANRFYSQIDKERYILRYGIYRAILSKYLNLRPVEIALKTSESGKPFVEKNQISISFTSSQHFCSIAIGKNLQLGVDIEQLKDDSEYRQMAKMFFSTDENIFLEQLAENNLTLAFLKIWTAKEAFIKANKVIDPAKFTISFANFPDRYNTLTFDNNTWHFYSLKNQFGLIITVVADKPNLIIKNIDNNLLSFPKK